MKIASGAACAISAAVTRYGASRLCRLVFGSSDMLTQASVTTQRAPATAASGSSVSSICAALRARPGDQLGRRAQRVGRGQAQREAEPRRRLDPAARDVVAVAAPGHHLPGDRAAMLLERQHVGHQLAGMATRRSGR